MAKKKSSSLSEASQVSLKLQELANSAQIQIQKLANEATEKSFQYNTAEANANRQWQTEMSNTSHQREVADLKAAGLNPVLSTNQGAMSYTSASASAQANDPSSAVGSLLGAQMNNVAQIGMTKMNNAAQLKAASTQAAAMKAAAAASAAAQKYAADQAYAANKYAWDAKTKLTKWQTKNAPQGTIAGVIDKHLGNTGVPNKITNSIKRAFSGVSFGQVLATYKNNNSFSLSSYGKSKVGAALSRLGITNSAYNQKLFVQGYMFGNKVAIAHLNRMRSRY